MFGDLQTYSVSLLDIIQTNTNSFEFSVPTVPTPGPNPAASSPLAPARGAGPATFGLAAASCLGRRRKRRSRTA